MEPTKNKCDFKGADPTFLAGLLDSTNLVVYLKDVEGRYIYVNRRYERLSTFPREALMGKTDYDFFRPEVADLFHSQDAQVIAHGGPLEFEETIPLPGGELSFITEKFPLFGADGKICAVGGFCTEITSQKNRADESLAEERERLAVTMRSISEGVVATDTRGVVTMLNPAAEGLAGILQADAAGKPIDEVIRAEGGGNEGALGRIVREALEAGASPSVSELRLPGAGSPVRTVLASAGVVRDRRGSVIGVVITLRDVTEQRRADAELFKVRSLKSLGLLAGAIAHDFNNILTGITGNLSLLQLSAGREALELIGEAQDACGVAKGLAYQLLTFSSGGRPVVAPADLRTLVMRTADFHARGSGVKCDFELGETPLVAGIDKDQVAQVVQNLVINAVQAMPQGGTVKVRAGLAPLGVNEVPPLAAGNYVRITFEDQGPGIPADNLAHVFDPYFTTKPSGKGLGLSVCHSIMTKHGGAISVVSASGGSVFTLYFPALSPADLPPEKPQPEVSGVSGRALLMDDEAFVARTSERMLRCLGYRAETVREGSAALAAYQRALEEGKPYDVVILDLTVREGLGGRETVRRILDLDPKARVLVSSGYYEDPVMSDYSAYGFSGALRKPYRVSELSEALRKARDGGKDAPPARAPGT